MRQGNVFTPVCQSFCLHGGVSGRGACVAGGMHAGAGGMHGGAGGMHGRGVWHGVCMAGGHAWWGMCMAGGMHGRAHAWQGAMHGGGACVAGGGMCGRRDGHCSGKYVSYWNAFLLKTPDTTVTNSLSGLSPPSKVL